MSTEKKPESKVNVDHFFSPDPFVVLGVPRGTSAQEANKAKQRLARQFHPDISKHPQAEEITKRILAAYEKISKGTVAEDAPPPPPRREEARPRPEQVEYAAEIKIAVELGPEFFGRTVERLKQRGITTEQIRAVVKAEEIQQILKSNFRVEVEVHGSRSSVEVLKYIQRWKKAGINLSKFTELPEVRRTIEMFAKSKVELFGIHGSAEFIKFRESWKQAGVDLTDFVHQSEVKNLLVQFVLTKIALFAYNGTRDFLDFVESWKEAGINLVSVVNSPEGSEHIERAVITKFQIDPKRAEAFLKSWQDAGWTPTAKALEYLKKK